MIEHNKNIYDDLSVVIPTLNAAGSLPACLESVGPAPEIVVADGGSDDGTVALAARLGAKTVAAPRGRGPQLAAGIEAAAGDWLLLLHADTRLPPDWAALAAGFTADPDNRGRAAYFRYAIDLDGPAARRMERLVAWRCRRLALPYGDQGLLLSRRLLEQVGGMPRVPIMEDVALARALGRRRLVMLDGAATTSGQRYRRSGIVARAARNLTCLALYFGGLPPRWIARLYG